MGKKAGWAGRTVKTLVVRFVRYGWPDGYLQPFFRCFLTPEEAGSGCDDFICDVFQSSDEGNEEMTLH